MMATSKCLIGLRLLKDGDDITKKGKTEGNKIAVNGNSLFLSGQCGTGKSCFYGKGDFNDTIVPPNCLFTGKSNHVSCLRVPCILSGFNS